MPIAPDYDPLVSVIIPVFNGAAFVEATLASVSAQTYAALEVIVVNDGSTDDTPAILERYTRSDPRVRVVHTPNRGLALTRNRGIDEAVGEYVAFIDADDLWHPQKIAKQIARMQAARGKLAFAYTYSRFIDAHDNWLEDCLAVRVEGPAFERHLLTNFVGSGSNILARRDAVLRCGKFRNDVVDGLAGGCADYDLQLELAATGEIGVVPEFLVGYRRYAGAMSTQAVRMARSRRVVIERHLRARDVSPECQRWASAALEVVDLGAALAGRDPRSALMSLYRLGANDPVRLLSELTRTMAERLAAPKSSTRSGSGFFELDPAVGLSPSEPRVLSRLVNQRLSILGSATWHDGQSAGARPEAASQ